MTIWWPSRRRLVYQGHWASFWEVRGADPNHLTQGLFKHPKGSLFWTCTINERSDHGDRERKTDRCSLTQSLPSMTSQIKGFNFLQHFSKATDVLFMADDVSWPWLGRDTQWLARLHPFPKTNSCEALPHHSPDLYTGQCLSLDFVEHSVRWLLEMNQTGLPSIFNSQLLIKLRPRS